MGKDELTGVGPEYLRRDNLTPIQQSTDGSDQKKQWWNREGKEKFAMKTILLVDDDEAFLKAQAQVLTKAGFNLILAENGASALEIFKTQPIDIVITDIIMPEIEGLETIQKMRQMNRNVKIIAISGGGRNTPDDYLVLARKLGALKSLSNPYTATELLNLIEELLQDAPLKAPASPKQ